MRRRVTDAACRGYRYTSWKARLDTANASITNRAALVDQLADELEMNLVLVGATAIEDQLQDMVPDTIAYLRQAGVKVRAASSYATLQHFPWSTC